MGLPQPAAPPHPLGQHFFGVTIENSYFNSPVPSWTDPAWLDAIRRVGIEAVRYPGGDAGNYWDWQSGTVYPRGSAAVTSDSLTDLAFLAKSTGAIPIYNLNVLTFDNALVDSSTRASAIENQMGMLSGAHRLGLPIAEIELGNEFFWTSPDDDAEFPTAADYSRARCAGGRLSLTDWSRAHRSAQPMAYAESRRKANYAQLSRHG